MISVTDYLGLSSPQTRADFRGYVRSFFRYEERLLPSEFVCRRIRLPAGKGESEPGKVDFAKRPFLREPLDTIADLTITDEVFVGPTRIGKTFITRMGLAYTIAGDPMPSLWVDSTIDKAKDISRKEIQPLIEGNAVLRNRKPRNRFNFTDTRMLFPAAAFTMVGGNSDAGVAGDTVGRVFGNELDKWRGSTEKEASIAELVRHRTESFEDERKHIWSCTPTLEEMTTWRYYLRGDQRLWQCRCPDCATMQALIWSNVIWDPAAQITEHKWDLRQVKATARYKCERCSSPWTDPMRHLAIRHPDAHYLATAVGEPGWRSHHVNGLYGPLRANNVGELAVDFLTTRTSGFYSDRQDFWNSRMGMPWRDNVGDISVEKFTALETPWLDGEKKDPYLRGEAGPAGFKPDLFILSFDVQSNRFPWIVRAWSWTGYSFLVDWGDAATWVDLDNVQEIYAKKFHCTSYGIGDINYEERRAEVLEQIYLRRDRGWLGADGFEKTNELVKLEKANVFLGGRLEKAGHFIEKLVISTYDFKVDLEKRISGDIRNMFYPQLPLAATEQEIEEQREYYKQRMDERRRPRKHPVATKPAMEFHSRNKNNHYNDDEVYGMALFWVLSKRRAYAQRKKAAAAETAAVEVKN